MSLFETMLLIFVFIFLLSTMFQSKKMIFNVQFLIVVLLISFTFHLLFDLIRWQFYLLYVMMFGLTVLFIWEQGDKLINKNLRRFILTVLSISYVISLLSILAFPIYEIPKPTGQYQIGTQTFVIDDFSRTEEYGEQDNRRFMIQIWYPAEQVSGYDLAPWLEGGIELSQALASDNYLPSFALNHTVHVMSNSYYNAPISESMDAYPVIIFSHGWRGFRTLHTDIIEELASHGYIVVSIDHTYGSIATVFSEDDISYVNLDALQPREINLDFLQDANQLVHTYSGDIMATLDYLEDLNGDVESDFYTKLDLNAIGHIGHSTGGGAGVQTVLLDDRIDALLGLDAWVEPIGQDGVSIGLDIPSLFLRSGAWETGENNPYLYSLINNSSIPSTLYQIDGTTHYDFAMVYMYSPLTKYIGFTGTVESDDLVILLRMTILDFFDQTLKGEEKTLNLDEIDEYHKVEIP